MMVTLISKPSSDPDLLAGIAASVCTRSTQHKSSLKSAMASGHESVAEHACFTFYVSGISRVTLAQLTRHRLASYSVESQRYTEVTGEPVLPETIRNNPELNEMVSSYMNTCAKLYHHLVKSGIPKEDARYILPEGTPTMAVITMNARELRHFFSLRCCNRAQWEIRELALRMRELCLKEAPILFSDSGPGCVKGKCPEGSRSCGHPWMVQ